MTAAPTHATTADPPQVGDAPPPPPPPTADTVRLYAPDWNAFLAWCKSEGLVAQGNRVKNCVTNR